MNKDIMLKQSCAFACHLSPPPNVDLSSTLPGSFSNLLHVIMSRMCSNQEIMRLLNDAGMIEMHWYVRSIWGVSILSGLLCLSV